MKRREFITLLGGSLAGQPLSGNAQNSALPRIGYLSSKEENAEASILAGVRKGLAGQGLVEGRNVAITYRWSSGQYDRLPALVADLIASKVDVIAASGLPASLAAKAATTTVPIVFRLAIDPVAFKLAKSFDRPGGNLTGVTMMFDPLTPKKLQLLHELVANRSIALLVNPKNPNATSHKDHAEAAARSLGLHLTVLTAGSPAEIEPAFVQGRQNRVGAVLVGDDPLFDVESARLVRAAAAHKIPTMFYVRDFVVGGGLFSYGPSFDEMATQVGVYLGRIIKGASAGELPVQQPTKFELVINLRTAKALSLKIPADWLARADEVIEQAPGATAANMAEASEREVYFEFIAIGNPVKCTAIDSITAIEVSVMGPVSASQVDMRQLALQKLKARLKRE